MTSLHRLTFVTGVVLLGAVALPVGCGTSSDMPPLPTGGDSAADAPADATHPKRDAASDVGVDQMLFPDAPSLDSTGAKDVKTDAPATNCSSPIKNGSETDVGCGGPICAPCTVGKHCAKDGACASAAGCEFSNGS